MTSSISFKYGLFSYFSLNVNVSSFIEYPGVFSLVYLFNFSKSPTNTKVKAAFFHQMQYRCVYLNLYNYSLILDVLMLL